jgi:hypothetical protein
MSSLDVQYYPIPVYSNQMEKTPEKNGYLKMPYPGKTNTPNIIIENSEYVCQNIYIFDKVHYSTYIEHDAIMVIEHKSITNDFRNLYLCIPLLESKTAQQNDLDGVIEPDEGSHILNIDVSQFLTVGGKCIVYENEGFAYNDYVILAKKPVFVNSDLSGFNVKPTMLSDCDSIDPIQSFSISKKDANSFVLVKDRIMDDDANVKEGFDDMPMICTQVIEEGEEVQYEPVVQLSASGTAAGSIQNKSGFIYFRILIQIMAVFIVSIVMVPKVIVPMITGISADTKKQQNCCSFLYLIFWIIAVLTIGIGYGVNHNPSEGIMGVYVLAMVAISRYMTSSVLAFNETSDGYVGHYGIGFFIGLLKSNIIYIGAALGLSSVIPSILFSQKLVNGADFTLIVLWSWFFLLFILLVSKVIKVGPVTSGPVGTT